VSVLQSPAQQHRIYRFGEFEYSVRTAELHKNGKLVRLQQQPLRVLLVLLEYTGDVVTREELRERIWPGDSVSDFDNSLRVAINKLRQALGDGTESPQYIETLPRRGYRWIYPVTVHGPAPSGADTEYRLVEEPGDRQLGHSNVHDIVGGNSSWAKKLLLTLTLVVAALGAGLVLRRPAQMPDPKLLPLTTYPGLEYMPAISPDGKRVAFAWTGPSITGSYAVYVKGISDDRARKLTETPSGASDGDPVWAPDGKSVYFFRRGGAQSGVHVASLDGKLARLVTPTALSGRRLRRSRFDVSPDGRSIVFPDAIDEQGTAALFLLDLSTMQRRQITRPPADSEGDGDPAFSHDGKTVAFQRDSLDSQQLYLWSNLQGERRVVSDNFIGDFIDGIAWTADDQELILGGQELRRVAVSSGPSTVNKIAYIPSPATFPAVRGTDLAFVQATVNANIWKLDLKDEVHVSGEPVQFIASTRQQAAPSFSPDGSSIAFQSDRSGTWEIWLCNRDGSEPVQLTHFGGPLTGTPRWSPDSKQVAFDSRVDGISQIYVVPAGGGNPRQLTVDGAGGEVPSWSRDGKWIYYSSVRNGEAKVWKVPAEGGVPQPVTKGPGIYAVESFDRKYLYFSRDSHNPVVWRIPVRGGTEEPVPGLPKPFDTSHWALASSGIYLVDANGDLQFFQFDRGTTTKVYHDPRFITDWSMAVSNDGREVIWAQIDDRAADLMLVKNFH
jgi:Tol biopolymer transport system component/DNA-binding winged helix-turn-helix (wHTH) protein